MSRHEEQPWPPDKATRYVRALASTDFDLFFTKHARERLFERGLIVSDALHVCQNGTVFEQAVGATQSGLFKYQIECETPNSEGRTVRLVAIPDTREPAIKIVTVMWVDGT